MLVIAIKCPFCFHSETKVTDKREAGSLGVARRRRECLGCKRRFTTYERMEFDLDVIKKNGQIEPYNRDKLKIGILKACEKRNISNEEIEKLINQIEDTLRSRNGKVKSKIIGELVMKSLKTLDEVAYIRFASVYREFRDVSDFKKQIKEMN